MLLQNHVSNSILLTYLGQGHGYELLLLADLQNVIYGMLLSEKGVAFRKIQLMREGFLLQV